MLGINKRGVCWVWLGSRERVSRVFGALRQFVDRITRETSSIIHLGINKVIINHQSINLGFEINAILSSLPPATYRPCFCTCQYASPFTGFPCHLKRCNLRTVSSRRPSKCHGREMPPYRKNDVLMYIWEITYLFERTCLQSISPHQHLSLVEILFSSSVSQPSKS
jgi:hypothetical protein